MFKHTTEIGTVVIDRWFGELDPEIACQVGNHFKILCGYIDIHQCRDWVPLEAVQSAGCAICRLHHCTRCTQ